MIEQALHELLAENARSIDKHGDWSGLSPYAMQKKVQDELNELTDALINDDLTGPHGMIAESLQLANVAMKMHVRLKEMAG